MKNYQEPQIIDKATVKQVAYIHALIKEIGWSDEE